jgi:transcriptional regulator with XRE-family HTH domain
VAQPSRDQSNENRIGSRVAEARRAAGLTRTELADRVGLRLWNVERIETSESTVPLAKLLEIAQATGRPLSWFTAEEPEEPETPGRGPQTVAPLEIDGPRAAREVPESAPDAGQERRVLGVLKAAAELEIDLARRLGRLAAELTPAEHAGEAGREPASGPTWPVERERLDELIERTRSALSSR